MTTPDTSLVRVSVHLRGDGSDIVHRVITLPDGTDGHILHLGDVTVHLNQIDPGVLDRIASVLTDVARRRAGTAGSVPAPEGAQPW